MGKKSFEDVKDNVVKYLEIKGKGDIREIYDFLFREDLIGGNMAISTQRLAGILRLDKSNRFINSGKKGPKGIRSQWTLNSNDS